MNRTPRTWTEAQLSSSQGRGRGAQPWQVKPEDPPRLARAQEGKRLSVLDFNQNLHQRTTAGGEEQVPARRSVAKGEKFPVDKSAITLRGQEREEALQAYPGLLEPQELNHKFHSFKAKLRLLFLLIKFMEWPGRGRTHEPASSPLFLKFVHQKKVKRH